MQVVIKPSDLYFRYHRNKTERDNPKFTGKPDKHPFDRDDLYEVIPMMEAIMAALETSDDRILHRLEEIMHYDLPRSLATREEVFDCLYEAMREIIDDQKSFAKKSTPV